MSTVAEHTYAISSARRSISIEQIVEDSKHENGEILKIVLGVSLSMVGILLLLMVVRNLLGSINKKRQSTEISRIVVQNESICLPKYSEGCASVEQTDDFCNIDIAHQSQLSINLTAIEMEKFRVVKFKRYLFKASTLIRYLNESIFGNIGAHNYFETRGMKDERGWCKVSVCSICRRKIKLNDYIREIPCKHIFHNECLYNYLLNIARNCPYCNMDLKYEACNG